VYLCYALLLVQETESKRAGNEEKTATFANVATCSS